MTTRLCTELRQDIDSNVKNGKTLVLFGTDLETRDLAKAYAFKTNSYIYEVHQKDEVNDSKTSWVGYGIPK